MIAPPNFSPIKSPVVRANSATKAKMPNATHGCHVVGAGFMQHMTQLSWDISRPQTS